MIKKRWWLVLLPLAAVLLLLWLFQPKHSPAVLSREELSQVSQGLDTISINAVFLPQSHSMRVRQTLTLVSRINEPRDSLVLRTMPNAFQSMDVTPLNDPEEFDRWYPEGFSMGALMMQNVIADGLPVSYRYLDDAKTVLSLPLSWQPGQSIRLELEYTLILPKAASRYGYLDGKYVFGNAFVLPAAWQDGQWRTDEYYPVGDPFCGDAYNFQVSVSAPDTFRCAATAAPQEEHSSEGKTVWSFNAPACRDFALVFSESDQEVTLQRGELTLRAFTRDPSQGRELLRYALAALETYGGLYGPYPYTSLTLAEFSYPYAAAAYPGLILLSSNVLMAGGQPLERTIAHETAHQWWYALVGSDAINHPWQDEALCEYSMLRYWSVRHGKAEADSLFSREYLPSQQISMNGTTGAPLGWFGSMSEYTILVYQRGAAMLWALDSMMQGGLDGFLRQYREKYAFRFATRDDFMNALAEYSDQDYQPLLIDYLDTLMTP